MHSKSQVERLLQRFRRKIAEVSDLSGHLAENFADLDSVAADTLRSLDADQPILGRQLRRLVAAGDNAFDRAAALETGLARALAHEQLDTHPLEPEALGLLVARRSLDFAGQLRVVYHLTLGDDSAWQELRRLSRPAAPQPSLDPVVRALRTLVTHLEPRDPTKAANEDPAAEVDSGPQGHTRPLPDSLDDLAPMHRLAVERAANEPLGFCRLVLEEALLLSRAADGPNSAPLGYVAALVDDPFLAAEDPVRHADLSARAALYLAEHHALANQLEHHRHWLDIAIPLLAEGSHDPELRALYFEARAARAVRQGQILPALRGLLRANVMLTELWPVDRRAETLLRYAIVLGHHPGAADRAPLVLETARAMLTRLEPEIHPSLRLRFQHFLADSEITGAYRRAGAFLLDERGLLHENRLLDPETAAPETAAPETATKEAPLDGNRSRGKGGYLDDPGGMGGPARALEAAARD